MQVSIKTYGCTLNQSDSELMTNVLRQSGIAVSEAPDAEVVVVNTCTVKKATEQKILYHLSNLEKQGKRIVVTGCMASANKDKISKYAPRASIVTTSNIQHITEAVKGASAGKKVVFDAYERTDKLALFNPGESVIAKVPVSEGCLSNCSFCETKFARGPLNSFSENLIIKAIKCSVERGSMEIQLTSQDMGAYGLEKGTNIAELMRKIAALDGNFKVRLGMLKPEHLHRYIDTLIEALREDKFYKFLHLPVQSGSDTILESMGRHYSSGEFLDYIKQLRDAIPDITLSTDVIVGYPGETDEDYESTKKLIGEIKPGITNISRFAQRPHARASKLKQLPQSTLNNRSTDLYRFTRALQHKENSRLIGKTVPVLITEKDIRSINGRTGEYKEVVIRDADDSLLLGSTISANIYEASISGVYGKAQ